MKEGILYLYTSVRTYKGVSEGGREGERGGGGGRDYVWERGHIIYTCTPTNIPHPDISAPPPAINTHA